MAAPGLSPRISPMTCRTACAPFTPSDSGQRSHPTYYRGCWHVVSRSLFLKYRPSSSFRKALYNPKVFIAHAALLHQAFAHCAIFPTAATRRCLARVSVPVWGATLSGPLPVVALVGRYPTNELMGRRSLPKWIAPSVARPLTLVTTWGISSSFPELFLALG